jgi:glycolate oxidase iron-sulfur subunit
MSGEIAFDSNHPPDRARIDKCVHCGFCLPTCPTYALWGEEMDSPRGRIYLMKAGLEGRVAMTDAFVGHFDACLGCMACVTACPSGVQYGPLIEATRGQIERRYARSAGDRLFRDAIFSIVPYPARLRFVLAPLVVYRWIQPLLARTGVLDLLPSRLRALATLAPRVGLGGLRGRVPEYTPATGTRRMTVGLLTGCVQRIVFSHVNEATIRVLAAEGCDVVAPSSQGCCGALQLHAGRLDDARGFARRTIEAFETSGVERIVVNAAGCGSSMKEYDQLLADDPAWAGRAAAFTGRVRDVTELLAELGAPQAPRHPLPLRVAYHDACHLAHAQGIRQQPRDLLAAIPGLKLVGFAEPDMCCGSAGIYNLVEPDAARDLGARKVRHIAEVEPDVVATANPGCTLQIAASAAQQGRPMTVLHPIELIDASIRGERVARHGGHAQHETTTNANAQHEGPTARSHEVS